MTLKRKLARLLVDTIDSWNKEIHQAIEERVIKEYKQTFPYSESDCQEKKIERVENMRNYYKAGISSTASLLTATAALLVSVIALFLSAIQMFFKL